MAQTKPKAIPAPAPKKLGKRALSKKMRELQSKRKTFVAGPGVQKKAPPLTEVVGPFDDKCSHACALRIAGASLQYIGDTLGGISRERARQLINEAKAKHPRLWDRVQKAIAKEKAAA